MKIYKKSSLGKSGKKIIVSLLAIVMVLCLSVSLAACAQNSDLTDTEQPDITGGNTDNTDNPGGDIENPAEDTDNSDGDKGESENPGGEIEEPENPGENVEEPENPNEDTQNPENPEEGDGNNEESEIPFIVDTISELTEYKGKTFYNYLNDNYLSSVVTKLAGRSAVVENAEGFEWAITGTEGETITELQVRFIYHKKGAYIYYVGTVVPNEAIAINDIFNSSVKNLLIYKNYTANTIEADMEQNQPLAEAIVTKLGGTLADSDLLLLTMATASTDPQYSWVRNCYVKQITETGVNEYTITINARNTYVENLINQLILNLQADEYKNGKVENNVILLAPAFDENSLDKQTPEFESELADNK